ncbi:hypothetical protein [Ralstonia pseudosolanacearum]|uniref:hypothetical protein n=1 Tax=Ralstonia pseudosolanacearum TaxID=1310165 RepID=UPI003CEF28CA
MYIITINHTKTETRTTLAGVLAFLNADKSIPRKITAELVTVHSVENGAIPVVGLSRGRIGLRPAGSVHEIFTRVISEIERFILKPDGKLLKPYEVSRDSWDAVMAAAWLAYESESLVDPNRLQEGSLFSEFQVENPERFILNEFSRRFGFGTAGPQAHPGGGACNQHEWHVAYALQRGERVKDCILNFYRHWGSVENCDVIWLRALIEYPLLRGALPAETLRNLCLLVRHEHITLTDQNVPKLIAILRALPVGSSYIDIDDALYDAKFLGPLTAPTYQPTPEQDAQPMSPLAKRVQECVNETVYEKTLARLRQEREAGNLSKRRFELHTLLAGRERNRGNFHYGNRIASAMLGRDVAMLLEILDNPNNKSTKRAIREVMEVNLLSVTGAERRRAIFHMCGFSQQEQDVWERQLNEAKAEKRRLEAMEQAKQAAESVRYAIGGGQVMTGKQYVDLCIAEGFSKIVPSRRGSAVSYLLVDPKREVGRPLKAKDGTLDYARACLTAPAERAPAHA